MEIMDDLDLNDLKDPVKATDLRNRLALLIVEARNDLARLEAVAAACDAVLKAQVKWQTYSKLPPHKWTRDQFEPKR